MEQKTTISEKSGGSIRDAYEAPAIEQTATFERLALMCSRTPAEAEEPGGPCEIPTASS